MNLAERIQSLSPSPTLAISAKAQELKKAGHDVIGLGVGEPDFNTPEFIIAAAQNAMQNGHTKYTPAGGIVELKQAIVNKLKRDNELTYATDEIIVTSGAKYALYNLFQVLLDEDDEVIVPAPYWVSYPEQVKLAGGKPVIVNAQEQNDFKLTPEQLEQAITSKTKAVIINSPSNPTGMMYDAEELRTLGDICVKHDVLIVSDEIYEELIYTDDKHVSIAQLSQALKEQTVIINGVSKSHAMTGWRIGFAAGNKNIIKAMTSMASHATSNPASISQYAALAAYEGPKSDIINMRAHFSERLDRLYNMIIDIPGVTCRKPKGAFYLFPNVEKTVHLNGFTTVDEWVAALLEEERVALVPGSGFGAPNNVRLSYATSLDTLEEAAKRIKRFVLNHKIK
ncbi:pyridoxal phosphate-dependent aminotransferase [Lentibacillus saliphilus]|uniref:pyridoxal phosphate-dependent aminotransferase n=1 Tax=Lentibacillus saliphilus TaxID=2737028 RepID=UPI001C305A37|nr:pyridoxal phosphate-dependent aminotransferase [Lentibacillus saliphilus]